MEKRINKKIESYISDFKEKIKEKAESLSMLKDGQHNDLIQFIYDFDRLSLSKEDFVKRKRVKNSINLTDRCCAKRANNEQCSRRKKEGCEYCGTHLKGTPNGICSNEIDEVSLTKKVEVWAQDIQGIIYFIDKMGNVYQTEDIISNQTNPKVISKWVKVDDKYTIPEFNALYSM